MKIKFALNAKQLARWEHFKKALEKANYRLAYEEGVAPMSPVQWHFRSGSISEDVYVTCQLEGDLIAEINLSLDDDGNFCQPFRCLIHGE